MAKIISNATATILALAFAKAIKDKFTGWKAFELGLINAKGKKLKNPSTKEEKEALTPLMNLIRKVKRVLIKVMPDSPIVNFVLAASLLKEEIQTDQHKAFWNAVNEVLDEKEMELLNEMITELKDLNIIIETTTTADIPTDVVVPQKRKQEKYNNCPCFDVSTDMLFDIRADDRKRYERLNKYYGDTDVAKFCRCKSNKGKTLYMRDTTHGMYRKLIAK